MRGLDPAADLLFCDSDTAFPSPSFRSPLGSLLPGLHLIQSLGWRGIGFHHLGESPRPRLKESDQPPRARWSSWKKDTNKTPDAS